MNRAEAYAKIKEYSLQETIKNRYGCIYTNLTTATLINEIKDYEYSLEPEECECECRLTALINILYKKHLLCKSEYESLMA